MEMLVFKERGGNRSTQRKTSRSRDENQQQTQPTYNANSRNRTRATLVGGECSHHCTIRAPPRHLKISFIPHIVSNKYPVQESEQNKTFKRKISVKPTFSLTLLPKIHSTATELDRQRLQYR